MISQDNRRTHTLTAAQRAKMIRLWSEGIKAGVLAKEFNVHPAYVRTAARRAGVRKNVARP